MSRNRVDQVEEWLRILDLPILTPQEVRLLLEPADFESSLLFEDLLRLCQERYRHTSFWPDFRLIGFDPVPKVLPPRQRIFAIGLC